MKKRKMKDYEKQMGKVVNGRRYVDANEKYDFLRKSREDYGYKPDGVSQAIWEARDMEGYSKMPRVKPSKKK